MKKKHARVLRMIQESVPKEFFDGLVTEEPIAPTVKFMFEKALESDTISEEKKKAVKAVLDSGQLDKRNLKTDETKAKLIEEYIEKEIDKAIALGRLPKKPGKIKKTFNKLKKKYGQSII